MIRVQSAFDADRRLINARFAEVVAPPRPVGDETVAEAIIRLLNERDAGEVDR